MSVGPNFHPSCITIWINASKLSLIPLVSCDRGDTMHYWTQMNYGAYCTHLCCQRTILHIITVVVRSRELGQAPILLFLTLRQALSSHPRQQMVWLCRLQDRDSIHIQYTINHPTTLHTQWNPLTHCCSPMALCTAGCIPQAKLPSFNS